MSLLMPRRHVDEPATWRLNAEVVEALGNAAERSLTGAIDVQDRGTASTARLFCFEGGLYAAHLDGYRNPVFARLRSAGAFDARAAAELAVLTGLDAPNPQAVATAVQQGWITAGRIADIHREFILAALGAVLGLGKVKVRERKARTTAEFCTLPLPFDSLMSVMRMRAERMVDTWSAIAPGVDPGSAVLVRAAGPGGHGPMPREMRAFEAEIDGVRGLDELAWALGLTRAEAVHVAAHLVSSGAVRLQGRPSDRESAFHLVPESFGSRPVDESSVPIVALAAAPAPAAVDDIDARERRLVAARAEVDRLQVELQRSMRAEQEAINHAAEVGQRLREARAVLARIEISESVPAGIA